MKEIRKQEIKREKKDRSKKKRTTAHLGRAKPAFPKPAHLLPTRTGTFYFLLPSLTDGTHPSAQPSSSSGRRSRPETESSLL
jgi:hypothetical protein